LKIISKRTRRQLASSPIPGLEVTEIHETSVIITSSSMDLMSPDDIKRAVEIFKEMRRQLESGTISINLHDVVYEG
jgi:hypothetical protein